VWPTETKKDIYPTSNQCLTPLTYALKLTKTILAPPPFSTQLKEPLAWENFKRKNEKWFHTL